MHVPAQNIKVNSTTNAKFSKKEELAKKMLVKFQQDFNVQNLLEFKAEPLERYIDQGKWWFAIHNTSTGDCWLYIPAVSGTPAKEGKLEKKGRKEAYKPIDASKLLDIDYMNGLHEAENPDTEKKIQQREAVDMVALNKGIDENYIEIATSLEKGTWRKNKLIKFEADKETFASEQDGRKNMLLKKLDKSKGAWNGYDLELRVMNTFTKLQEGLNSGKIEATAQLDKQISKVLNIAEKLKDKLNKTPSSDTESINGHKEKFGKQASEALSELEYAVIIAVNEAKENSFFSIGAQGHRRSGMGTKELQKGFDSENVESSLPPIGVLNMEVDAYYITKEGILRADEVKDTPRALADKLQLGGQISRQIEWVQQKVRNPETNSFYKKQVGFFVQAEEPYFYQLCTSEKILANLASLEIHQPGIPLVRIGSKKFTLENLREIGKKMSAWAKQEQLKVEKSLAVIMDKNFSNVSEALKIIDFVI